MLTGVSIMNLSHITSHSLKRVLSLTERKDELVQLVSEIETEITKLLSGFVGAVSPKQGTPTKDTPRKKTRKARRGKSGNLTSKIVAVLENAGPDGMRVKDIAAAVGSPAPNVSVWISTTGKKFVVRVEPGIYAIKGAQPAAEKPATTTKKTTRKSKTTDGKRSNKFNPSKSKGI